MIDAVQRENAVGYIWYVVRSDHPAALRPDWARERRQPHSWMTLWATLLGSGDEGL
jgi:hypothetical protein